MIAFSSEQTEIIIGGSLVRIGRYTYGLEETEILQWNEGATLVIGSFCSIAQRVTFILGGNHRMDWTSTYPFGHIFQDHFGVDVSPGHPSRSGDIVVGSDVWIGDGATIVSGVTIGDGAVVAANSHVVKDIGPYEIWGGNPARKIRDRFSDEITQLLLRLKWWDYPTDFISKNLEILCSAPSLTALNALLEKADVQIVDTKPGGLYPGQSPPL